MSKEVAALSDWRLEMTRPEGSDGEGDDWDDEDDQVGATDGSGLGHDNVDADEEEGDGAQTEEAAIRQKYGLGPARGTHQSLTQGEAAGQSSFSWGNASAAELQRLTSQNSQLLHKIAERDREVHRLEELVLAMEPPPGLDAGRLMEAQQSGHGSDPRDAKILDLAKRVRCLNVALGKERRARHRAENSPSPIQSPSASSSRGVGGEDGGSPRVEQQGQQGHKILQRRLQASNRKVDELQASVRTYRQVLRRELGDDATVDAALDQTPQQQQQQQRGGWRGRAQQIVMLKAKVKRLTSELRALKDDGGPDRSPMDGAAAASNPPTPRDVDARASKRLEEAAQARQESFEQLEHRNEALEAEKASLTRRADALRARTTVLENETKDLRQQTATLLQKSELDDKLVDGLREERSQLQRRLTQLQRTAGTSASASPSSRANLGGSASVSSSVKIGGMSTQQLREAREAVQAGDSPQVPVDMHRVLEDSERVARLSKDQARRLDGQEKLLQSMKHEVARLRDENASLAQQQQQQGQGQRRPVSSSSDVRRAAADEADRKEMREQVQWLQAERSRLEELQRHTDRRVRELERQLESAIRRNRDLEQRAAPQSRTSAKPATSSSVSCSVSSSEELQRLQAQLEQLRSEKETLERKLEGREPHKSIHSAGRNPSAPSRSQTHSSSSSKEPSRPGRLITTPPPPPQAGQSSMSPRRPDLSSPRAADQVDIVTGRGDGDDGDSWGASHSGASDLQGIDDDADDVSLGHDADREEWADFGDWGAVGGAHTMEDAEETQGAGTGEGKDAEESSADGNAPVMSYAVRRPEEKTSNRGGRPSARGRGSVRQELTAIRRRMAGSRGR